MKPQGNLDFLAANRVDVMNLTLIHSFVDTHQQFQFLFHAGHLLGLLVDLLFQCLTLAFGAGELLLNVSICICNVDIPLRIKITRPEVHEQARSHVGEKATETVTVHGW